MASSSDRAAEDSSIIPAVTQRQLETFGRKVTATAGHLIGPLGGESGISQHYHHALGDIQRELRRPAIQRSILSFTQSSPREIIRSKLSVPEIEHRALAYIPDDILYNVPAPTNTYSLFQGFQALIPEEDKHKGKKHGRHGSRGRRLLENVESTPGPPALEKLNNEKYETSHRLEMLAVRKNMCSTEIHDIDARISNLNNMRRIVLDRLAGLEQDEMDLETELLGLDNKIEDMREELEDEAALAPRTPTSIEVQDEK